MTDEAFSRRQFMATSGLAATAGLAGCLGGDLDELSVAYMPIYPDLQYFVMEGEGYFEEVDSDIDAREFTNGPAIVQAFGGGEIDIAMFGMVPSMIVSDRGIPAKVTAANIKEPMGIMGHRDFNALFEEHGADAFDMWAEETGDKFTFGTFPQGSTPDVLLRYWLRDIVGIDPETDVDILEIGGANAVWQAIANGEIDGTSIMEPVPTIAQEEGSPVEMLRTATEVMPGQPAAVVTMADEVRDTEIAEQFLRQHVRATEFIEANPDRTAEHVESGIGMPVDRARKALDSPLSNFITDPREIEEGTKIFSQFAHENGQIDEELSMDQIFDYSVYDSL
ncbi:ABC transporter substrate-binding protein [Natronoarchaeum sp. GCM10025703]|uniref:ABC transporter substrate-binding protein n=2 Tax=unclassified Natronoarchaeum TaxID=2620183 RepID=UPI00360DE864